MSYAKRALRRDPAIPIGEPSPLHVLCACGARLGIEPPHGATCPCGLTYDARGWIVRTYDAAFRAGLAGFYEASTDTLRSIPENYCLAHRRPNGRWRAYRDEGATSNFHDAFEAVLRAHEDRTPDALAHLLGHAWRVLA